MTARTLDYDDVPVRVIDPEHLVALGLQAGGYKRRERHRHQASLPIREKVRVLLQLQRQDLPLLGKQRPLRAWEKHLPPSDTMGHLDSKACMSRPLAVPIRDASLISCGSIRDRYPWQPFH